MSRDDDNERFVRDFQAYAKTRDAYADDVDGWAGTETRKAAHELCGMPLAAQEPSRTHPEASGWPRPDQRSLEAFYGPPGARQVLVDLPYPMRLAWDPDVVVRRTRCHELVAASLGRVLGSILREYEAKEVRRRGLDLLGGVFNLRKMRDRDLWSVHAWGAAIDIDPVRNGLRTPWPDRAFMPLRVIQLFEAEGWTSLGRVIGRDAMHFQATTW